ncbi:PLC-like phosphodiesterase [Ascodesmis nigricans]|uniref:Phosphoinositide phospholipase C n=1 Tax=Ascodesmis nigricans TaxID=341454 RepID=A0A4V3SIF8_9PEZI|nr:PLC-like phosphodiesterase [Ascodesmis nigricans]
MGKEAADTPLTAGGGSTHSTPADLSSPILQKAIASIHASLSGHSFRILQSDPLAPENPTLADLTAYLSSPLNSLQSVPKNKDWSRPLNEYFISSSHNTYLTGHQLYGSSTSDGYINVLSRGCRCVEIDVWDGDDGEPEVFHGYTLTKEMKFKDVCKTIRKYGFSDQEGERWEGPGEGPIIISLECHASHEQQLRMVEIMKKEWGDMLVQGIDPEDVKVLPSPEELRRKIVVKAKYVPPTPEEVAVQEVAAAVETLAINEPEKARPRKSRSSGNDSDTTSSSSDSELEAMSAAANKQKPKKTKVVRAFARLGAYASSHHFPAKSGHPEPFTGHPTSLIPNHVYSFSEKVFKKHNEAFRGGIIEHNKRHLMRVYPFGLRFGSSNADSHTLLTFWLHGVQLVALNWQSLDEAMMLNEALFSSEGGYVLKPPGLKPHDPVPSLPLHTLSLTLTVLAASAIPLPSASDNPASFEPYVKAELHTADDAASGKEIKRRTKTQKGVDVMWGSRGGVKGKLREMVKRAEGEVVVGEQLVFEGIKGVAKEKLSFLRIKVHDDEFGKDDLAAWACVRVDRLQMGWRVVRLWDSRGRRSKGVLLVKVEMKWD